MYVCMYICMYVYMYVCMYVCVYVCMHVYMYACMYACMHVCMYVCMYVCMFVCMYVCKYVCMYVCMYVYDMTWDMIWYDMMIYDMIWYDMIWYDMIWYDMIWSYVILYGTLMGQFGVLKIWGNNIDRAYDTYIIQYILLSFPIFYILGHGYTIVMSYCIVVISDTMIAHTSMTFLSNNSTFYFIPLVLSLILLVKFSHVINKYKWYSTALE